MLRRITKVFFRLVMAVIVIFVVNSFEPLTNVFLSLNIFNVAMIALFDIFGVALCIVLKFIL